MRFAGGVCVCFALLLFTSSYSNAVEIVVRPDGPLTSISQALQKAADGDTIRVIGGVYREGNIVIDKPVVLLGEGNPVIDGQASGEVFTLHADDITLQGFVIRNAGVSFIAENAAIKAKGVRRARILDNRLENNFFGIYFEQSAECTVEGNDISAQAARESTSGNGIHLWYCKEMRIIDNHIRGHRDGIYFEFVEESEVLANVSEENLRYGLHFMFSNRCRYRGNVFRHNGAGVAVMYTHAVEMRGNRFEQNWGPAAYGLLLKEITDSRIEGNIFDANTVGVYTEGSNRLLIRENTFRQNGWAVRVMANSMDNTFENNNFFENTFDVATNSRQNFNMFRGNYWSTYGGYDLDKDGRGDVPFRPVRLFSFVVEKQPAALILLRSMFIDLLDLAERMLPVLTPETLVDTSPRMHPVQIMPAKEIQNAQPE